jgi:hypothetical protein
MESFIVKNSNQPQLGNENFDPLRADKTKIPPATKRDYEIVAFNIAIKMIKCFRYLPWMSNPDVISVTGKRINSDSEVYMPKFRRK